MEASTIEIPEAHVVLPTGEHTHTIILLHGRGGCGEDFAEEVFEGINTSDFPNCKWIFPGTAEIYDATFQEDMAQWFDLQTTSDPHREPERQVEGLKQSAARINAMIDDEIRSIPASNIVLGGMSQGYATAANVLMTRPRALGGFIGISGWLPFVAELNTEKSPAFLSSVAENAVEFSKTPALLEHSADDNVIEVEHGQAARDKLQSLGLEPAYHEYATGEHEIEETQGFQDIKDFLQRVTRS